MKKYLLILSFFFFNLIGGFTQNPMTGEKSWFQPDNGDLRFVGGNTYTLDQQGNDIMEIKYSWNIIDREEVPFETTYKTYNSENQITSFKNQITNAAELLQTTEEEYFYKNNCLDLKNVTVHITDFLVKQETYYYSNCKIDSVEIYTKPSINLDPRNFVQRYYYTDNEEKVVNFRINAFGVYIEQSTETTIRNDRGQILNKFSRGFQSTVSEGYKNEFDEFGNLTNYTRYKYWYNSDTTIIKSIDFYTNIYNDLDQLVQIDGTYLISTLTGFSSGIYGSEFLAYSCDGLLKEKRVASSDSSSPFTSIYRYEYRDGYDCDLQKDKEPLLQVRPNFTEGFVFLESEVLRTKNSQIAIYDMTGRRIQHFKTNRIFSYRLDLSDLPAGNYVIHVFNKNYSAAERVVKM